MVKKKEQAPATETSDIQKLLDAVDFNAVMPKNTRQGDPRYDTVLQHFVDSGKPCAKFDYTVLDVMEKTAVHGLRSHIKASPKFKGLVAISEKNKSSEIWLIRP